VVRRPVVSQSCAPLVEVVHAAIGTAAQGVFDLVALSAICLGDEVLEVFSSRFSELVQAGLLVNEAVGFPGKQE
jgi:hypothetical protein